MDPLATENPQRQRLVGRIAGITSKCGTDDPRLPALREQLKAAELEEHIKRAVESWPPLSTEQRERLANLLRGETS